MTGWIYDTELNDYLTFDEYRRKLLDKEKEKLVNALAEALVKVFTEKITLTVDSRTGELLPVAREEKT